MKGKHILILFLILSAGNIETAAQERNPYLLLTEPFLERPYTLHRNILQVTGTYSYLNGNRYFDDSGARQPFSVLSRSSIENRYLFGVTYGLLEFVELSAGSRYRNRYETRPTYYVSNESNIGSENTTYRYSGFTNLELMLRLRIPFEPKGFDHSFHAGVLLPFPDQQPRIPMHEITLYNPADPGGSYELNYLYRPAPGIPGVTWQAGARVRYTFGSLGLALHGKYLSPVGETESYTWKQRLQGESFDYRKVPFTMYPNRHLSLLGEMQGQVFPWFAIFGGYHYSKVIPGWTDITGQQVRMKEQVLGTLTAGFEIQVSTGFRIHQQLFIPLHGKEIYSEFSVMTGLIYSIMPFSYAP